MRENFQFESGESDEDPSLGIAITQLKHGKIGVMEEKGLLYHTA